MKVTKIEKTFWYDGSLREATIPVGLGVEYTKDGFYHLVEVPKNASPFLVGCMKTEGLYYKESEVIEASEMIKNLRDWLRRIEGWPGNLKDEVLETYTGANDAYARGCMVTAMRSFAQEALK
jgi:hypothetical protein